MPEHGATSLDLGSGAGVPGLVLAYERSDSAWVLLDASATKTAFLTEAVATLGLADRVVVVTGRAEDIGRRTEHRGAYAVVVARSFARPAVLAECAAPLLEVGGILLVSEPPEQGQRWPSEVSGLGLSVLDGDGASPQLAILRQEQLCPERFPRRVGIPAKRPLW